MKTTFSRHAWHRVAERLTLSAREVADLLDTERAVNIGVEPGTKRVHRLFFSLPDEMCFVAIQDLANHTVVTVVPVDFHENIAWNVSALAQLQARAMVCGRQNPEVSDALGSATPDSGARVFRLTAYARTKEESFRVHNLGSWPGAPYSCCVQKLIEDDKFFEALGERIRERVASKGGRVETVFVTIGNKGERFEIAFTRWQYLVSDVADID